MDPALHSFPGIRKELMEWNDATVLTLSTVLLLYVLFPLALDEILHSHGSTAAREGWGDGPSQTEENSSRSPLQRAWWPAECRPGTFPPPNSAHPIMAYNGFTQNDIAAFHHDCEYT